MTDTTPETSTDEPLVLDQPPIDIQHERITIMLDIYGDTLITPRCPEHTIQAIIDLCHRHERELFAEAHRLWKNVSLSVTAPGAATAIKTKMAELHDAEEHRDDHECAWCPHNRDGTPA